MRDKLRAVERTMERPEDGGVRERPSWTCLVMRVPAGGAAVQLFAIRDGTTIARDVFLLENVGDSPDDEALRLSSSSIRGGFVNSAARARPRLPADAGDLVAFLEARRGKRVVLTAPSAVRAGLMDLAARNAAETLAREQTRWLADEGKTLAALEELGGALGLASLPLRIECYDISTIRAPTPWAAGRLRGGAATKRRVPALPGQIGRRHRRLCQSSRGAAASVLSSARGGGGGRRGAALAAARPRCHRRWLGQVNAARAVMDQFGLHDMPVIGLAKEREEIPARPAAAPRAAGKFTGALLLQRLRDEAHRFAVTYHRKLRARADEVRARRLPGVGPARKRALLRVFGSARQMRSATIDELASVPGITARSPRRFTRA